MFNPFQRITVYVKIHPDKIEIINLKTGEAFVKTPAEPFSLPRLLVADYNVAEALCKEMIDELRLKHKPLRVVLQQMKGFDDPMSMSEKRILRDLGEQMGGVAVFIITDDRYLSNAEVLSLTKEVFK